MSKSAWLLILILGLALFVRLWGIDYGLPYFLVNDERALVYSALKMGELKTLVPTLHPAEFDIMNYKYNYLMSYVYLLFLIPFVSVYYFFGSFSGFGELMNYFILNPAPLWLVARVVTALIGAATVYLIYLIGRKAFNNWVGLIAALFLALSFLHIQLSHFARPWAPMAFFTCLVMLLSLYIYQFPKRKYYLWIGLALGLAFGVSAGTSVIAFIFLLAHFLIKGRSFSQKLKNSDFWLAIIIFFLVAVVFSLVSPQSQSTLGFAGESLLEGKDLGGYLEGFILNLKAVFFYDPLVLSFFLLGSFAFLFKPKNLFFVSLSWPVFYISALYIFSPEEYFMPVTRYLLLLIPWLAVFAGLAVYNIALFLKSSPFRWMFLVLVFIYPLIITLQYDYLLTQKDTRLLALDWVEKNIPASSKIISDWSYVNPIPNKEAILFQQELDKGSLRIQDNILLSLSEEDYPKPSYNLLKLAYINEEIDLTEITQSSDHQYFLKEAHFWREKPQTEIEKELVSRGELIVEFSQNPLGKSEDIAESFIRPSFILFFLERPGPVIRIYKL